MQMKGSCEQKPTTWVVSGMGRRGWWQEGLSGVIEWDVSISGPSDKDGTGKALHC